MHCNRPLALLGVALACGVLGAQAPPAGDQSAKLTTLLQERRDLARSQFDLYRKAAREYGERLAAMHKAIGTGGTGDRATIVELRLAHLDADRVTEQLYRWGQRLLAAELDLSARPADRRAAYEGNLTRMKELEESFKKRDAVTDSAEARFHRIEAEALLERACAK